MAWTAKFNFRSTAAYVTDSSDEIYVKSGTGAVNDPGEAYSISRAPSGGTPTVTFGWTGATDTTTRDRIDTGVDHRLAGMHSNGGANTATFRVDLPAAGVYDIRIAAGDYASQFSTIKFQFADNGSSLWTINSGTTNPSGNSFLDAVGAEYSSANWITSNTAKRLTFSTTTFQLVIGDGSSTQTGIVAHLVIDQVSAASGSAPMFRGS